MCTNKMPPINSFFIHPLPLSLPPPSSLHLMEKPRVTEIHVRMDCNGCVQKIKKALHGINGIYELYIDFPQQKLTIIGWADPEKIVKAIKKTRKIATICSHTEQQTDPAAQPPEQAPENGAPAPEVANPPPAEAPPPADAAPPAEAASLAEPPRESPPPQQPAPEPATPTPVAAETNPGQQIHHQRPRDVGEVHTIDHHGHHPPGQSPPPQQPAPEPAAPTPVATETNPGQQIHHQRPRDVGEVHTIYHHGHHPPDYGYRYAYSQGYNGYWNGYHNSQGPPTETAPIPTPMGPSPMTPAAMGPPPMSPSTMSHTPAPPMYVTHSYNTYRPSPYVTEYQYIQPPPQPTHLSRTNHYNEEQHYVNGNGNGNITSIFSDENPNACTVM
ncbi:leucine-rich repeat extensin-like protein 3 isoform X1 [Pyrus communis]|uniref:leucine-rich repeat extensin-like protein 3 isoform X1 n=1 Tax=Pyrus communis TaxID=23211 RepID=UPI0035C053BB